MSRLVDARGEHRRTVAVSATVSVDGKAIVARTRDISRSGICLVSDSPVPPDTAIEVSLVLSIGPGSVSEPLGLSGRSVWCTALFGKYQVGVKFVGIEGERRRFLDVFMRFMDGEVHGTGAGGDDDRASTRARGDDPDDPFRP